MLILLQVDTQDLYSHLLQRVKLFKQFLKICLISTKLFNLSPTLKNSLRIQQLKEVNKNKYSTVSLKAAIIKSPIILLTLSFNLADFLTFLRLFKLTFLIARFSTKKKTLKLSQLNNWTNKKKNKLFKPIRKANLMSDSKLPIKLIQLFLVDFKSMLDHLSLIAHLDQDWQNSKQNWLKFDLHMMKILNSKYIIVSIKNNIYKDIQINDYE